LKRQDTGSFDVTNDFCEEEVLDNFSARVCYLRDHRYNCSKKRCKTHRDNHRCYERVLGGCSNLDQQRVLSKNREPPSGRSSLLPETCSQMSLLEGISRGVSNAGSRIFSTVTSRTRPSEDRASRQSSSSDISDDFRELVESAKHQRRSEKRRVVLVDKATQTENDFPIIIRSCSPSASVISLHRQESQPCSSLVGGANHCCQKSVAPALTIYLNHH
jgi:hypothetical protein